MRARIASPMSAGVAVNVAPSSSVHVGSPARASAAALSSRQLCGVDRAALGIVGQAAAGAGIGAAGIAVRRGQRGGDVGAGAEAGIDQAFAPSAGRAPRHKARSARDWTSGSPSQSRPSQRKILDRSRRRTRAGSGPGRDPRSAAGTARRSAAPRMAERRAIGMAEVEPAGRRGREAGDDHASDCCQSELLTASRGKCCHDACHAGLASGWSQGKTGRSALSSLRATGPGGGVRTDRTRKARCARMYHPDLIRHPDSCPALVLNADYTPLSLLSA